MVLANQASSVTLGQPGLKPEEKCMLQFRKFQLVYESKLGLKKHKTSLEEISISRQIMVLFSDLADYQTKRKT